MLHAGAPGSGPGWAGLAHHTIFFGDEWERTFDEIIYRGQLMTDPSLLVTRPTATDPGLAPDGRELLYILAPCPNLHTAPLDWATLGSAYRDELVGTLERRGLADLDDAIEVEKLVTPADWAAQGLAVGTPFSAAHTFAQTGPFRPSNLVPRPDQRRARRMRHNAWGGCPHRDHLRQARRSSDHHDRSPPKHRHERLNQRWHRRLGSTGHS